MKMNDSEIITAVKEAVALHRDSVKNLRARMEALLNPLPASVTLEVGGHRLSYRKISGHCSQWSNYAYPVENSKPAYVIDDAYLLDAPDLDFFDGSNYQYHFGGYYLDGQRIRPARAGVLREVAKALPAALLSYAECAKKGAEENNTLLAKES